jgi:hypothetical protein
LTLRHHLRIVHHEVDGRRGQRADRTGELRGEIL